MLLSCFVKEVWNQKTKRNSNKTLYCHEFCSLHLQFKWKMFLQFCNIFSQWKPVQYIYFPWESLNSQWFHQQRDKKAPSRICAGPKQTLHLTIICLIWPLNDIWSLTSPNERSLFYLCDKRMRALRYIEFTGSLIAEDGKERPCISPYLANVRKCGEMPTSSLLLNPSWWNWDGETWNSSGSIHIKLLAVVAIGEWEWIKKYIHFFSY